MRESDISIRGRYSMKRLPVFLIFVLMIAVLSLAGCKGSSGDAGPAGSTGATGATGPQGPTLPSVSYMSPGQSDTNIALDAVIRVGFTKDMLASTVTTTSNFTVTCEGVSLPGTISYNSGSKTAYFDPANGLPAFSFVTVRLSGMQDTQANALPQYTASFYTGGSFAPSRLYVVNYSVGGIGAFNSPGSAGEDSLPDRLISGATTSLSDTWDMWLDSSADRLYVSDASRIVIFNNASTITGNIAPSRVISGASTTLSAAYGIWLDAVRDELYVASWANSRIVVFSQASTTAGNIAPSRIISGATTSLSSPYGLWLDSANDRLYVSNGGNSAGSILVFNNARTASGNIAPNRIISGPSTTLTGPRKMWLDSEADQLYVAGANGKSVNVYNNASTINGDVAPSRKIMGAGTGFVWPSGIWLDKTTNRLYVADPFVGAVLVFNSAGTADGNVTPIKEIPFAGAQGVWLDTGDY